MSVDTRSARARVKLPPEQPAIPQGKSGSAGYWLYLIPGLVLLLVIVIALSLLMAGESSNWV